MIDRRALEWLARAAVSTAAGVASSVVLVRTADRDDVEETAPSALARRQARKRRPSGKRRSAPPTVFGVDALKEEASALAKEAVVNKVKAGAGRRTTEVVEGGREAVRRASDGLRDVVGEDVEARVKAAATSVKRTGKSVGETFNKTIGDAGQRRAAGEKIMSSIDDLGRFLEGPGAPAYREAETEQRALEQNVVDAVIDGEDEEDALQQRKADGGDRSGEEEPSVP